MGYPKERKEAVLKKMMPHHNKPIPELADEEGISIGTLYNWRNQARRNGQLLPDADLSPERWSRQVKNFEPVGDVYLNPIKKEEAALPM